MGNQAWGQGLQAVRSMSRALRRIVGSSPPTAGAPETHTVAAVSEQLPTPSCTDRLQGDVAAIPSILVGSGETVVRVDTPHGVAVLSQTCDIRQRVRSTVVVAPVVRKEGNEAKEANLGRRPGLVRLPALGPGWFADLDTVTTITKVQLEQAAVVPGVDVGQEQELGEFGKRIGRRFARFPYPDEVVPWLSPLETVLQTRHNSAQSPEKFALEKVVQLRIEAGLEGWPGGPPYDLSLHVILRAGTLAPTDDENFEISDGTRAWLCKNGTQPSRNATEIAQRLFPAQGTSDLSDPDRNFLWSALAQCWADRCQPAKAHAQDSTVMSAVRNNRVSAEVASDDEFSMARMHRTTALDLDHLSPAFPIGDNLMGA